MDFLKSAVASAISKGPPFPYTFGDRVDLDQSIWTLYNGTRREDSSDCSIFSFDVAKNPRMLPLARNAVRKLRTLRHPGIVKILDTVETETFIYVATERVTPLGWHLRRKSIREETSKWGLFQVAITLAFINDEAVSVHGNIRASSIFTSQSGEWRIGGLEILSSMKEDDAVVYNYGNLVPDLSRYAPPEVAKSGWNIIKTNPIAAADSYNLGILISEIFNGSVVDNDNAVQSKSIPPSMRQSYKRLLNPNPKARLSVSSFRDQGKRSGGFFETPLIRLSEGVERLGLKSDGEREEFLSELDEVADDFPEEFFKMKVLPELLKSLEYGGGGPRVFASVMRIAAKLSEDDYDTKVTPVIIRLFSNPDRAIRVCLLDNLPNMIDHLSQKVVNDRIFPQMITGFSDVAPIVREQTVKAVLTIITKLSDRTINGELLKQLAKTANDEQPGIRTNTTICLGKIARNLGQHTRQKVLIAAFARSLRDPFVHGRNAALLALAATSDLFTEEDCANKILPSLCPSLVDKEKLIRDQANKTFDIYVQRVRKYGSSMPETVLPSSSIGAANGAAPRMGTPQNDTSWAGWAISSFTNKIASASGDIQPKQPPALLAGIKEGPSHLVSNGARATDHRQQLLQSTVPLKLTEQKLGTPSFVSSAAETTPSARTFASDPKPQRLTDQDSENRQAEEDEIDEAWGDMGGDSFFDAPSELNVSTPTLEATFDDGGEPDFEGWLKTQTGTKAKPPLPKSLSKPSTLSNGRQQITRTTTTGSVGSGLGTKKLASTTPASRTKPFNTKPKETVADDDWGDAWD